MVGLAGVDPPLLARRRKRKLLHFVYAAIVQVLALTLTVSGPAFATSAPESPREKVFVFRVALG